MIMPIIGPERDIHAPDVNTTPEIMGWIMDTYSMQKATRARRGHGQTHQLERLAGPPAARATGRGVMLCATLMEKLGRC